MRLIIKNVTDLPPVVAGPILRHCDAKQVNFWMVTSQAFQLSCCIIRLDNGETIVDRILTNEDIQHVKIGTNAIINLIDEPGKVSSGSVLLGDLNIHEDPENIVKYRGKKVGLIFQDPQTSLNPILTIGEQLIETIQTHLELTKEEAKQRSINLLNEVGIKDATKRFDDYPHQFSGGMRQRVVISLDS